MIHSHSNSLPLQKFKIIMRIIFFGTPGFAVPSLEILYNAGYDIVGVVTSVDKLGGRGRKTIIESAIKKKALELGLNILQPKNLKSEKFIKELESLKAEVQIVVAFRMLPEVVWNMPREGTYNLHGSLLPAFRGAAPINWAIIQGESFTGVTTFKLKHEIDTGMILHQKKIKIYQDDNAGSVHDRMMWVGADLIYETVRDIEIGNPQLNKQDETKVSKAPKLNDKNTKIDFHQESDRVYDFIRGLSPYPGAWFELEGKRTKVYEAESIKERHNYTSGEILSDNKTFIKVACKDGLIQINNLQMSGKKKMLTKPFLNGYKLTLS